MRLKIKHLLMIFIAVWFTGCSSQINPMDLKKQIDLLESRLNNTISYDEKRKIRGDLVRLRKRQNY